MSSSQSLNYKYIFLVVYLCFVNTIIAQEINFDHYTTKDGLAHNSGNAIIQDHTGYLWIGSNAGLERFDGYTFKTYKSIPGDSTSQSGSIVSALYEDSEKNLWVGTIGRGLNKFVTKTESFISYKNDAENKKSLSNNNIAFVVEDKQKNIWVGTKGGGLNLFNSKDNSFTRFKYSSDIQIITDNDILQSCCIIEDELWIGADYGMFIINPETKKIRDYYKVQHDLDFARYRAVKSILRTKEDYVWIGTFRAGLFKLNLITKEVHEYILSDQKKISFRGNISNAILEDHLGDVWIGTEKGLNKYDRTTDSFINYFHSSINPKSLSDENISTLYEDKSGVIWIGTNNGGLNKFDLFRKKFKHGFNNNSKSNSQISDNNIFSISEDSFGNMWYGTREGLNKFDIFSSEYHTYKKDLTNPYSLSHNKINAIAMGVGSTIWVGSDDGLNKFDYKTEKFETFKFNATSSNTISNDIIYSLAYNKKENNLWIGSWGGGLDRYELSTGKFTNFSIDNENYTNNVVINILDYDDNTLWLGTYGHGLVKFDKIKEDFTYYEADPNDRNNLNNNVVLYLHKDLDGIIWVCTAGGGFLRFNPSTEIFRKFDTKNGLPTNEITGVLEDDHNNLWISTGKGISKFDKAKETFVNFDSYDGLQDDVFYQHSCFKSSKGEMYFGGINGFNVFYPDSIKQNPYVPNVIISEIQINNHSVSIGQKFNGRVILDKSILETNEIILTPDENIFSIEFAALHFASPRKNKYSYILENLNDHWIETNASRRFVSYTTLEPGKYIFRVKASNNDGIWNDEERSLSILVLPPFWSTWWAYILYAVITFTIIFGYIKYKTSAQKRELAILRSADRLKTEFLAQMSHEIRTPINVILSFSNLIESEIHDKVGPELHEGLSSISKSGKRIIRTIDLILNMSQVQTGTYDYKPKTIDIKKDILDQIILEYSQAAKEKKIALKINVINNLPAMKLDEYTVTQIFINLIDNAIKYTEEGYVNVNIEKDKDGIPSVTVEDTGIGIKESYIPYLFDSFTQEEQGYGRKFEGNGLGLALVKKYCEINNAEISVDSKRDKGSKFIIVFK